MNRTFFVGVAVALLSTSLASAQDLLQRGESRATGNAAPAVTEYRGRDRLDLRATAALPQLVPDSGSARLGIDATLDADFACGKFDVKATIKNLLGREAREDFLKGLVGALESQFTYNALVLACEASPTACQAFQHFRVNANSMLGIQYNRCQAVEAAVKDSLQGMKARAVKECVEEKRKAGKSMSEALEACENSDSIKSFDGSNVRQIDLLGEMKKTFGMNEVDFKKLQTLLSPLKIGPSGANGEVRADGALKRFDELNREYQDAWTRTLEQVRKDPKPEPAPEELKKLAPSGQPGPLPVELRELGQLPDPQRRIVIRTISSRAALLQLTMEVQEAGRKLAALRKSPQMDEGRVRLLERESDDLKLQIHQIDELVRRQEDYSREFLQATALAGRSQMGLVDQVIKNSADVHRDERLFKDVAPKFGTLKGCPIGECGSKAGSSKGNR